MNFDELEKKMRLFETEFDLSVPPDKFMVARLDGHGFTRLTKEVHEFAPPLDKRFRDMMTATVEHLMNCGFKIKYAYTQSDEISLLFDQSEDAFDRKTSKLNSLLAGEASARFSLLLKGMACFDCRISQLPTEALVVDYFRWRNEDAHRKAQNTYCYWMLREKGESFKEANSTLLGLSDDEKNEMLAQSDINFNDFPLWHRRGVGLLWEEFDKPAVNLFTGERGTARHRRIRVDYELPTQDEYGEYIRNLLANGCPSKKT